MFFTTVCSQLNMNGKMSFSTFRSLMDAEAEMRQGQVEMEAFFGGLLCMGNCAFI
jgi:hypothetical protein